jgi:tetratricopeptide (TPR) repeat protein
MEIRILSAGKEIGPYSEAQVRQYLSEGIVAPGDLAICDGLAEWQQLEDLLNRLPAVKAAALTARRKTAGQGVTVRATTTQRTKRGPIVLQTPFAEATEEAPKRPAPVPAAVEIEPPRPTTQLPPVAKFVPTGARKTYRGLPSLEALSPDQFFPGRSTEPATAAKSAAPDVAKLVANPVADPDVAPANPPHAPTTLPAPVDAAILETGAEPEPDIEPRERDADAGFGLPSYVTYGAVALALVLLVAVAAGVYIVLHFNAPAPRGSTGVTPGAAAVTTPAPNIDQPRTAADFTARGLARQQQNNLNDALSDYDQAVDLDPGYAEGVYRRAVARETKMDWDGALEDFNHLLVLQPDNADAFSNRGFCKQARGDLDGAMADYTEALKRDPKIAAAYYNIGLIKVRRGDIDGGIAAYDRALDLNPKLTRAYYNRGIAKTSEGNLDGAIADYTRALELDATQGSFYLARGFARQSKGDLDGALADYGAGLNRDPKMPGAYYNRGQIEVQRGNFNDAIADNTTAIVLDPGNAQAFCNRGLAEMGEGAWSTAETDLHHYCELAPRDSGCDAARLYLWVAESMQRQQPQADDELVNAMESEWNSSPEDLTSKIAGFLVGHIRESELIADAATPDHNREPGRYCKVWYYAAIKRLVGNDPGNALADFQKSVGTNQTDYCEYLFSRSELTSLGQTRQAENQVPLATP